MGQHSGARQPALIGRDAAVAALTSAVEASLGGERRLVLLAGEPGIGKTALATVAAGYAEERGAVAAWGVCWDGDGAPGFWPWTQALGSLTRAGVLRADAELTRAGLGGSPADSPDGGPDVPASARFRLFAAVADALRDAAARRPLVVVLDDLQWADPGSLRLLEFVVRHVRSARLLLLGTYRDVDPTVGAPLRELLAGLAGQAETYALSGLDADDVRRLLADLCVVATPAISAGGADLAETVHRRTGGNPFFVQEAARLLVAGSTWSIPAAVGEAVGRRLSGLSRPTSELLCVAAVIGTTFDLGVLAGAAGRPRTDVDLDEAVRARIVRAVDDTTYRFEHDLFRETIVGRLSAQARRRAHAAVATALERGLAPPTAELAFHYGQAGAEVDVRRAIQATMAAGRDATRCMAYEEASRLWRQVLRLSEDAGRDPPPQAMVELADASRRSGEHAEARRAYLDAAAQAERAGDPERLVRAALGLHHLGTGVDVSHRDVVELLERALAAGPARPARALAALARELADGPQRDVARARGLAGEAVAAAREDAGDPGAVAFCLFAQHDVVWGPGTAQERLAIAEQMGAAAAGDPELAFEARFCRFIAQIDRGDPAAVVTLRELERMASASRLPHQRYLVVSRRATMETLRGSYAEATALIDEAYALGEAIGEPDRDGVRLTQLLVLGLAREGPQAAVRLEREYGVVAPEEFEPEMRGLSAVADGDPDAAVAILRGSAPAVQRAWFRWRAMSALAFDVEIAAVAGHGAADVRRSCYESLLPYAGEVVAIGGASAVLGPTSFYLGLLAAASGEPERARQHLAEALGVAERIGARPLAARIRVELGRALLASGARGGADADRDRIRRLFAEARPVAEELGLAPVLRRLAETEGADGAPPPAKPASAGSPATRDGENVFRREGGVWTLTYRGRTVRLPDAKGLRDLAVLLAVPGQEVSAARLLAGEHTPGGADGDLAVAAAEFGGDPVLDETARAAYRARLADLDEELDRAGAHRDEGRLRRLSAEREAVIAELRRAAGLGGRGRRLGDAGERARTTVTARLRDSLRRIERHHPDLGRHLRQSVVTGRSCAYRPAEHVAWRL